MAWRLKVIFLAGFLLALPLAWNALGYLNLNPRFGFLLLKQSAVETGWYLPAFYSHVIVSAFVLVIGFFQVYQPWRLRFPNFHRVFGKIYVAGILIFAAPGGMVMSFFIQRGPWVLMSFVLQSLLWFFTTLRAYESIRKGEVVLHQQWMVRSFALTLAAITLRLYAFLTSWTFDLTHPVAYAFIAWWSWVFNLMVAEVWIRRRQPQIL
ncbi:MAG: DUF2306 domain-containing protein [Cyclobacteriaceae bacterium]|nr:DUF2306 domain-containing protein [Cyclobacteriaceae bacterium]